MLSAKSRKLVLKCPIRKTKNVSRADRAGEENEENKIATAARMQSSRKIRKIAHQIFAASDAPPT